MLTPCRFVLFDKRIIAIIVVRQILRSSDQFNLLFFAGIVFEKQINCETTHIIFLLTVICRDGNIYSSANGKRRTEKELNKNSNDKKFK